jgi:beta-N-acetylhexosaminidase
MKPLKPEQIAGQRLLVGFDGTEFNDDLRFLIGELAVGGIILFSRNIETPDQVRELCRSSQDYAEQTGLPPLFIAIDQEGGQVSRLKHPSFTQFPSGNPGMTGIDDASHFAAVTARELKDIGVNMNMAPVLDVQPEGFEGVMAKRVFNGGPDFVSDMGNSLINGFQDRGIMAVAKHFPGIGRTTLDSHLYLPILETGQDELAASDFLPFEAAIRNNVAGIMMSHIQFKSLDNQWPASLSANIVKSLLRDRMGYQGLVMTDDLDMKAIKVPIEVSVNRIVEADVDIALICHKGPDIEKAYDVFTGIDPEINRRSFQRIMDVKKRFLGV